MRLSTLTDSLSKRTVVTALMIFIAIPATLAVGMFGFMYQRYYLTSLLIIFYVTIPFVMVFERRRPQARELIIIAVLSAIAVAGRAAFSALPQISPAAAVVIVAGACFGPETGFLTGATSAFVSNFFLGQGPWTPWQMFCMGIIGFLAGILFRKDRLQKKRTQLSVFGGLAVFLIYGGIMDPVSVLMFQGYLTKETVLAAYAAGIWFNLLHAGGTAVFLFFAAQQMTDKLERVKTKYGLIKPQARPGHR